MAIFSRLAGFLIIVGLIGLLGPSFGLTIRGINDPNTARIVGGVCLGIGLLFIFLGMSGKKRS